MDAENTENVVSNDEALEIEGLHATIAGLAQRNSELETTLSELSLENASLQITVDDLSEQNQLLYEQNGILQSGLSAQNQILETELSELQTSAETLIEQNQVQIENTVKIQYTFSIFLCFVVLYAVWSIGKIFYKWLSSFF